MKWDKRLLEMAKLVSTWSKDPSTQVGAVIVRPDKTIASVGFNGFPSKMPDESGLLFNRDEKYSRIIHAEINAQIFCQDASLQGYALYTWPFMSCDRCVVQMIQAGITRIVATKATGVQAVRWSESFAKTRQYCQECSVELVEVEL